MKKTSYLNLNYKPDLNNEIIAEYYLESSLPLAEVAQEIAAESSIGTWTKLSTLTDKTFQALAPQIFFIHPPSGTVKIAYPLALFETASIPQLLSALAGNIYSMKAVGHLRLNDLIFPDKYLKNFTGPAFGIEGIRKMLNIKNRAIIGSIIKPKVGLSALEHAKLSYAVWSNGVDLVKDDENLTDMSFNRFNDRVDKVMFYLKKAEKETGQKKIHAFNITGLPDVMLNRAKYVKKHGGKCVMVDIVSIGLDSVQYLRKQNLGLIIHGHRAGHAMFTREKNEGMSMLVLAKLARMAGVDQLHTGTVVGKMEGTAEEVLSINKALQIKWGKSNLKPVLPIASGGLHPGLVKPLIKILGNDLIVNFGGGLHGHPGGSTAGAKACYQAVMSAKDKTFNPKKYPELEIALQKWPVTHATKDY